VKIKESVHTRTHTEPFYLLIKDYLIPLYNTKYTQKEQFCWNIQKFSYRSENNFVGSV